MSNGQSWGGDPPSTSSEEPTCCGTSGVLTATQKFGHDPHRVRQPREARITRSWKPERPSRRPRRAESVPVLRPRRWRSSPASWCPTRTKQRSPTSGEFSNYQTSSQVSSAISSALSSFDNGTRVDNKIVTALLDFFSRAETEHIADAVSGAGFLDQTAGDARYLARAPGAESGHINNLVQKQFTPRIIRNLFLEAPLTGDAILGNQSTLRIRIDSWSGRSGRPLPADQRSRIPGRPVLRHRPRH